MLLTNHLRRAKLKRLTTDDQERMLKSRALPEGFNATHALHSVYEGNPSFLELQTPNSIYPPTIREGHPMRPLSTDTLSRMNENDGTISPISIASSFGDFYPTPGSLSTAENPSPISPASDMSHYFTPPTPQGTSPQGSNPFAGSDSFPNVYQTYQPNPRSSRQDTLSQSRKGSLASPLWMGMPRPAGTITQNAADVENLQSPVPLNEHRGRDVTAEIDMGLEGNVIYGGVFGSQFTAAHHSIMRQRTWSLQHELGAGLPGGSFANPMEAIPRPRFGSLTGLSQLYHTQTLRDIQSAPLAAPPDFQLPRRNVFLQPAVATPRLATHVPIPHGSLHHTPAQPEGTYLAQSPQPFSAEQGQYQSPAEQHDSKEITPKPEPCDDRQ